MHRQFRAIWHCHGYDVQRHRPAIRHHILVSGTSGRYGKQHRSVLYCSQCHDNLWGKRLAGNVVPQGHPTGYPVYRLEWQGIGSLQRRLRNCLSGMRAEVPPYGAPELVELELFLMWRARGLPIETPAVRP